MNETCESELGMAVIPSKILEQVNDLPMPSPSSPIICPSEQDIRIASIEALAIVDKA